MSERELFEDAYRKVQLIENDGDTFEQYPNGNYVRFSLNLAWLMWQASANRQGYKIVPKSFIADIHDMALDGKYLRETDQSQEKFTEIHELCKEAMIGAAE